MPQIETASGLIHYELKRTRRRSLALRISPDGFVVVSAPRFALGLWIDRFIRQQADWIMKHLQRFAERSREAPPKEFVTNDRFYLDGRDLTLEVSDETTAGCALEGNRLRVSAAPQGKDRPLEVRRSLEKWYWNQTEERITAAIERFSALLGVSPQRVIVARQKARWGSCSTRAELRFNWRLSMLPPEIVDAVVVHELAHIRVHNHSSHFWAVVASVMPDYRLRRAWLRKNAHKLTF